MATQIKGRRARAKAAATSKPKTPQRKQTVKKAPAKPKAAQRKQAVKKAPAKAKTPLKGAATRSRGDGSRPRLKLPARFVAAKGAAPKNAVAHAHKAISCAMQIKDKKNAVVTVGQLTMFLTQVTGIADSPAAARKMIETAINKKQIKAA